VRRTVWVAAACALPSFFGPPLVTGASQAQTGAMVQAIPSQAAVETLNQNLAKLSRNPQDVTALLGAGQAALDLSDFQAANGFFTRANMVNPRLGKAKLGLAVVALQLKQPQDAATNFDAADALGEGADRYLSDRGLAYDLTGQQAKAQRDYRIALQITPKDEKLILRYAVSLGISGQLAEADKLMEPSLTAGNREAWRLRAFIYAMNGRQSEARRITQSVMPKGLADALDPYMLRVSLLNPAQKAAAAHYGDFPANMLRLAAPAAVSDVQLAEATPAKKEPPKKERDRRGRQPVPVSTPTPTPAPVIVKRELTPPGPPPQQIAIADPLPQPPIRRTPQTAMTTGPARQPLSSSNVTPTAGTRSGPAAAGDPKSISAFTSPAATQPAPASSSIAAPSGSISASGPVAPPRVALADALKALDVPEAERKPTAPAVDMAAVAKVQEDRRKAEQDRAKKEAAAKAKALADEKAKEEAAAKAKLKANPSRIWVQIAAGKNVDALAFDMRRFRRTYADAIGDETGWYADWGQTHRLLVGPFKKQDAAKDIVAKIAKSGGDAFVWLSEAGEEVSKVGGK